MKYTTKPYRAKPQVITKRVMGGFTTKAIITSITAISRLLPVLGVFFIAGYSILLTINNDVIKTIKGMALAGMLKALKCPNCSSKIVKVANMPAPPGIGKPSNTPCFECGVTLNLASLSAPHKTNIQVTIRLKSLSASKYLV